MIRRKVYLFFSKKNTDHIVIAHTPTIIAHLEHFSSKGNTDNFECYTSIIIDRLSCETTSAGDCT